jgi:hypothetical protein
MTLICSQVEQAEQQQYWSDPYNPGRKALVARSRALFLRENNITIVSSEKYSGKNRHSGNQWWRWQNVASRGFRINHKGTIIPYSISYDKNNIYSMINRGSDPFSDLHVRAGFDVEYAFKLRAREYFGIDSLKSVYPMAEVYHLEEYNSIPKGMLQNFRQTNAKDYVTSIFGKDRYRRDLLKAACSTTPEIVAIAKEFRGLVPIDWIINFMRNHSKENAFPVNGFSVKGLRNVLTQLDPRSYRYLLNDTEDRLDRWAADIARRRRVNGPIRATSFHNLHDELYPTYGGYEYVQSNEAIKLIGAAKELDGLVIDDLTFHPARETNDMVKWSSEMSNCISGYTSEAINGRGVYAAVERDGKVIANIEIVNNRLKQLLGKYNQSLDDTTKIKIVNALNDKGVETVGDWWGK